MMGGAPFRLQAAERLLDVRPGDRGERSQIVVALKRQHVQVAQAVGEIAQRAQILAQPPGGALREHAGKLPHQRPRAPYRDPQVVQKLGIDVVDHAVHVPLHHGEQKGHNRARRFDAGHLRVQIERQLGRIGHPLLGCEQTCERPIGFARLAAERAEP